MEIFLQMDLPGLVTLLGSIICFVLALQWGGIIKPWGSADVVGTLVGCVVLLVLFIIIQAFQGDRALLVGRTLKMRNILACCLYIFLQVFSHLKSLHPGKLTALQSEYGLLSHMLLPTHLLSSH